MMLNDYYYENVLIENDGIELSLGMINGFEYVMHFFKWSSIRTNVVADNQDELILVYCLCRSPGEALEDYGTVAMSLQDMPHIIRAVRQLKAELEEGIIFVPDPESSYVDMYPDRDWLAHGLNQYGGKLIQMEDRIIHDEYNQNVSSWAGIAHVHQWLERDLDRKPIRYNVLITEFGRQLNSPDSKYDAHDYCSVTIPLDKVEVFISALEALREKML